MPTLPLGAPALPLDEGGKYVAAAYIVFVVLLVIYVSIMAIKLQRIERELRELATFAEQGGETEQRPPGTPGREAEDVPVYSQTQPPVGSDRNLVPSEATGGPSAESGGGGA
jgi:hypothetical protein